MIGLGGGGMDGTDQEGLHTVILVTLTTQKCLKACPGLISLSPALKAKGAGGWGGGPLSRFIYNITSVWPLLVPYRGLYIARILLSLLHISLQAETWLPFLPTPGCYINRTMMSCWGPLGRPPRQVPQLPYDCDPAVEGRFGCHANFLNGSYGYFGGESGYPESNSYRNSPGSLVRNCQEECWFFIST